MSETTECALWYWHYHVPMFSVCDSEAEAAAEAWYIGEAGEGAIVGVQFPDGRLVKVTDWDTYRAEEARQLERERAEDRERASSPPPPTHMVKDPWEGTPFTVFDCDVPPWLERLLERA